MLNCEVRARAAALLETRQFDLLASKHGLAKVCMKVDRSCYEGCSKKHFNHSRLRQAFNGITFNIVGRIGIQR